MSRDSDRTFIKLFNAFIYCPVKLFKILQTRFLKNNSLKKAKSLLFKKNKSVIILACFTELSQQLNQSVPTRTSEQVCAKRANCAARAAERAGLVAPNEPLRPDSLPFLFFSACLRSF